MTSSAPPASAPRRRTPSPSPRRRPGRRASRPAGRSAGRAPARIASALVTHTSFHTLAGLDARRVESTSPRPATRRPSACTAPPTTSISALAASCGRWLTNAITRSCSSASIVTGRAPRPATNARQPVARPSASSACGREDPRPAPEQVGPREPEAALLRAANRVAADEAQRRPRRPRGLDGVALGAADVGDHAPCSRTRAGSSVSSRVFWRTGAASITRSTAGSSARSPRR